MKDRPWAGKLSEGLRCFLFVNFAHLAVHLLLDAWNIPARYATGSCDIGIPPPLIAAHGLFWNV